MTKKHFKIFAALIKQSTMSENEKVAFVNALSKKCQEENATFLYGRNSTQHIKNKYNLSYYTTSRYDGFLSSPVMNGSIQIIINTK